MDQRAGLDLLVRVDAHTGLQHALLADRHLVPHRDAFADPDVRADVAGAPDDRALDQRRSPDVRARVDHAVRRSRVLAQGHVRGQHRVRADGRLGEDPAVVADERRPLHRAEVVQVDALADPHVPAQADPRHVEANALVERVGVRLSVLLEVPDVLPVALEDVAVQRPSHLEQQREELLREVVGAVVRDVRQHLRLEDVDAGVDRVGEDLAPRRLLEEALDATVLVGDDDPELERVVDRLQADRHGGAALPVRREHRAQVDVAQRVTGDDEDRLVEPPRREPHRPGSAERRLLDRVRDVHPERLTVAEVRANRLRQERDGDDHVLEAVFLQQLDDVLHARLADDRDHRLRLVRREWTEARALAAGHDDGLHARTSRRAFSTYCAAASSARPSPIQKSQSGQCGAVVRDHRESERRVEHPGRELAQGVHLEVVAARHDELVPAERAEHPARGRPRAR